MIPKIIHYCWFGRNPKPKLAEKCLKSWRKYCPDYEIIEWNEDNYDLESAPLYVRQAYEEKKWAFVTDYVRLQVVYEHGGIYLDTDVELIKRLDLLLKYDAYFGFEDGKHISTGLGFGAVKGFPVLQELMDDYLSIPFVKPDGTYDLTACPTRNTQVFLRHGLLQNNKRQMLDNGVLILPSVFLCPIDYQTNIRKISISTISIHWFSASWQTQEQKMQHEEYCKQVEILKRQSRIHYMKHLPNLLLMKLLGNKKYEQLKEYLRKG